MVCVNLITYFRKDSSFITRFVNPDCASFALGTSSLGLGVLCTYVKPSLTLPNVFPDVILSEATAAGVVAKHMESNGNAFLENGRSESALKQDKRQSVPAI
jgi:hypothetical protein